MTEHDTIYSLKEKGLSNSTLKIIAIISMLIDHIGAALILPQLPSHPSLCTFYYILRLCGRIAFPIFCFLLVEGFFHTRNAARYGLRLALFALLSEVPFDLAFHKQLFYPEAQNVFFTLLIGLLTIYALHSVKRALPANSFVKQAAEIFIMLIGMFAAWILKTDYDWIGVFVIMILYCYHENKTLSSCACCFLLCLQNLLEISAFLAVPLIRAYNKKRGISLKYVFYLFYPLHLLLLYIIGKFL